MKDKAKKQIVEFGQKSTQDSTDLLELPDEIKMYIFKRLGYKEWLALSFVCSALRRVSLDNILWRRYYFDSPKGEKTLSGDQFWRKAAEDYVAQEQPESYSEGDFFRALGAIKRGMVSPKIVLNSCCSRIRKMPDIVDAMIQKVGSDIRWFYRETTEAVADRGFLLTFLRQNGLALMYLNDKSKLDREMVMAAVRRSGIALRYTSDTLKKDRDVVLAAVRQNGEALKFADSQLKKDRKVVLVAVNNCGLAYSAVNRGLQADPEVKRAAVTNYGYALGSIPKCHHTYELALIAVSKSGSAIRFVDRNMERYRDLVLAALSQNGQAIEFLPLELLDDKEVVLTAVRQWRHAIDYASDRLKADPDVQLAATVGDLKGLKLT